MRDPKVDPSRRCMPESEWPANDQAAWQSALRRGDPFEGTGPAARWSDATRHKTAKSYGRWLTFLERQGDLDPAAEPWERITPERLKLYVSELAEQVAPVTLAQRIAELREALRVMAPGRPIPLLERVMRVYAARAEPVREAQKRIISARRLFELGLRLMDEADADTAVRVDWRASRYRDGLVIAILACRAPRSRNLHAMVLGHSIRRIDERYVLTFEDTKNHRPLEESLPLALTDRIERYLTLYRPALLTRGNHDAFWISALGRPMAHGSIYDKVREVTERELGYALNLHRFRNCLASSMAIDDPEHVRSAATILGHADFRTTERFYLQAATLTAGRDYQAAITNLRRRTKRERRLGRRSPGDTP